MFTTVLAALFSTTRGGNPYLIELDWVIENVPELGSRCPKGTYTDCGDSNSECLVCVWNNLDYEAAERILVDGGFYEYLRGRRRSYEEIHEICHGASEQVQGMFRQTLAILAGSGSNQEPLVGMAAEIRQWCNTLSEHTGARRQCQGYAGLLIELTMNDEHPASVMLVGAYGDLKEQESACGTIVNTLNQALFDGHFEGLAVTKQTVGYEQHPTDTVVAVSQQRVEAVTGSVVPAHAVSTAGLYIGGSLVSTVYMLIKICHDYSNTARELL